MWGNDLKKGSEVRRENAVPSSKRGLKTNGKSKREARFSDSMEEEGGRCRSNVALKGVISGKVIAEY